MFYRCLRAFQGCFKIVPWVFPWNFQSVSRVLQWSSKKVSNEFKVSLKEVSRGFQGGFKFLFEISRMCKESFRNILRSS